MFVDDGSLALVLIAAITAAAKLLALPPLVGGVLLLGGCLCCTAFAAPRGAQANDQWPLINRG